MKIIDIQDNPNYTPNTGSVGIDSVSLGLVTWDNEQKAICIKHGAMNCVSEGRDIWRCVHVIPDCRNGCFVLKETK